MLNKLLGWLKRLLVGSKAVESQEHSSTEGVESKAEKILEEVRRCEESLQKTAEEIAEKTQSILEQLQLQQEALAGKGTSSKGEVAQPQSQAPEQDRVEEEPDATVEGEPEEPSLELEVEEESSGPEILPTEEPVEVVEAPTRDPDEDITDVVIGLDFGTSRCKVIMRAPYMPGSPAYPVLFDFIEDSPLLLPTEVYQSESGEFSLKKDEGFELIRGLKVDLMDKPTEGDSKANVVGYLALVLRYARSWFKKENYESFGNYRLHWSVTLGLPSSGSQDKGMRGDFQEVLEAAWGLSVTEDKCTVQAARVVLEGRGDETGDVAALSLREEVVAEVQGYCRSYNKRLGLHVMVDVGASTLDICGFTLFKSPEGEPGQALLVPEVERLGILHLRKATDETGNVESEFQNDCARALFKVLTALIKDKDPNAPAFKRGEPLRVFLCGGGGLDPFYEKVVKRVEKIFKDKMLSFGGFHIESIPRHEDIQWPTDIDETHYHRMAVAFGLSFFEEEVGDVFPPDSVEDIAPPDYEPPGPSIGKEQV